MEPRLGKSKAALDYCGILALKGEVKRVLILAPRIALDVWEQEIEKHYPYRCKIEDFENEWLNSAWTDPRRNMSIVRDTQFFLAGREETMVKRNGERPKQRILEKWDPDVIILDESHEYKRPGGRGAQDCWRMVRRLRKRRARNGQPYVLLLSGTPNPKGWRDLFAQYRIMDEGVFGTSNADFEERYVIRGHGKRKWTIIKYRHEKELVRKIRDHSIVVSADEAGLANVQSFQHLKVQLPDRVRKMYLQLAEDYMVEWEGGVISAKNSGVKRIRLLQITGGFTTEGQQVHSAKVDQLHAYLKVLLEQGESVVVYSRFTPEVRACTTCAEDVGFRTFRVDGSTSAKGRRLGIQSLAKRPSSPVAVCFQHQAGSRAIELVGAAETVYYSLPDGWVDFWQTLKRTQGPNQPRPVRYTALTCPGTVDVSAWRGLRKKEDAHATMMKNPKRYLLGL